jgi:peroxin-4
MEAVNYLLLNPEPNSPLNCDAANLLRVGDRRGYASLAQYYTVTYAKK